MSYKIRVVSKKQELKKPDEFLSTLDWLVEISQRYARVLLGIVGGVILLGAGIAGFMWYEHQQEEAASALGVKAFRFFQSAVSASLEVPPSDPSSPAEKAGEADRLKREENFKKAIELYQQIVSEYPRTPTAVLSRYYLGNSYLELQEYEEAVSAYQAFTRHGSAAPSLQGLAQQRLAYAYIALGNMTQAEASFLAGANIQEGFNQDSSLFELGRLQEAQGKNDKAIETYQSIMKNHPESILATEARTRLRGLGVETEAPEPAGPASPVAPPGMAPEGTVFPPDPDEPASPAPESLPD